MESKKKEIINNFIYIQSGNFYISKKRANLKLSWYDCHKQLHQEGLLMPTIPQFISFIKYLKKNQGKNLLDVSSSEIKNILDDILTVRGPWRSEWLDAWFEEKNAEMYINYDHRTVNNELVPQTSEQLENCLMNYGVVEISLENFLKNHTYQDLPKENVKSGRFYYWPPKKGSTTRFFSDPYRLGLVCDFEPNRTLADVYPIINK